MKYSALLQLVTPRRQTLLLILSLLLFSSAISLANPWIAGILTETLLNGPAEGKPGLRTILVAWLGLVAIRSIVSISSHLSLARALMKDPPILIHDEATSMFDPEGKTGFIHDCRGLLHQLTVILITHRPASLALADRILKLEKQVF